MAGRFHFASCLPAARCRSATPRWDRFLDEITLGNTELKTFLLRLCALCLTAHPFQGLFFLWGRGRNGKGVLLRLLVHILGQGFTASFRPNELAVSKYDEDKARRSFNKLEAARLATVDESLGSNLNLPILKLMSGGDNISAARMRQDDRQFKPTHKLVLPTNEKPICRMTRHSGDAFSSFLFSRTSATAPDRIRTWRKRCSQKLPAFSPS